MARIWRFTGVWWTDSNIRGGNGSRRGTSLAAPLFAKAASAGFEEF